MQAFQVTKIAKPTEVLVQCGLGWVELKDQDGNAAIGWVDGKRDCINVVRNLKTLSGYTIRSMDCRETCEAAKALFA